MNLNLEGRRVHSRNLRIIKDVPYGDFKVQLHLLAKKYFNDNPKVNKLTIAENVNFVGESKRRTKRLDEYILKNM